MKQLHCLAFPYKVANEKASFIELRKFLRRDLEIRLNWAVANPPKFVRYFHCKIFVLNRNGHVLGLKYVHSEGTLVFKIF